LSDLIVESVQDPFNLTVNDSDVFLIAESAGSTIISPGGETIVLVEQPPAPPFIHVYEPTEVLLTTEPGVPGPAGPPGADGYIPPKGPVFTYTNGVLTGILYDDGSTKELSYTNGVLTTLVFVRGGVTSTKTFNYTNGVLTSINEVIT
jgi:hypothetical protein